MRTCYTHMQENLNKKKERKKRGLFGIVSPCLNKRIKKVCEEAGICSLVSSDNLKMHEALYSTPKTSKLKVMKVILSI